MPHGVHDPLTLQGGPPTIVGEIKVGPDHDYNPV